MMKIVDNTRDYLTLRDAESVWAKWGFIGAVIMLLVVAILIALFVIRPACSSGAVIGFVILLLFIREIPKSYEREYRFERTNRALKLIQYPWIGKPSVIHHDLGDILAVRLVKTGRVVRSSGYDDFQEESRPVEPPAVELQLEMRSGEKIMLYGTAPHAGVIAEFLGLALTE